MEATAFLDYLRETSGTADLADALAAILQWRRAGSTGRIAPAAAEIPVAV